ncbi:MULTISPECIES: hypothetical protein [Phaeobacter]|uniref:hypothetical protein n=1 Tax=Phaeobacter TaxID=302485 RepID=UPI00058D22C8|nr:MULTISPECIES: hypothetical protein [Phaeobacter]KII14127.1 hypothetical protein OO25_13980 [Phaeobacter sp. S60]
MVLLMRAMRPSKLLDKLHPTRSKPEAWKKLQDRSPETYGTPIPIDLSDFSFLDAPQKTLDGLVEIAKAEATSASAIINFNDTFCQDVAPFMLLVECWDEMLPIFEGGKMNVPMQKVLAAIGVEYALGVRFAGIKDFNDVWAFPLNRRRGEGETRSKQRYIDVQTREEATDSFCDAMNEWLARPEINRELSNSGVGWIKQLLGELLENAERHADGQRRDGSWSISGFLAKRDVGEEKIFVVQLGIISLGDTFAESLERARPEQKNDINEYIANMKRLGATQSNETLTTLAALQDGVTCVAEADEEGRGGTGLMEMLHLVDTLGYTRKSQFQPKVTIISGAACINLEEPYFRGSVMTEDSKTRVQWCNPNNSAMSAPDSKHVFDLDRGLPGTAISIRFTLDPDYLSQAEN